MVRAKEKLAIMKALQNFTNEIANVAEVSHEFLGDGLQRLCFKCSKEVANDIIRHAVSMGLPHERNSEGVNIYG